MLHYSSQSSAAPSPHRESPRPLMRRPRARCPGASLWRVARLRWPRLGARGLCLVAICLAAACACARAAPAAWQRHAGGPGGASAPPPPPAPAPAPAPGGSFASGAEAQAEASEAEGDLEAALRASSADEVGLAGQRMHWGGVWDSLDAPAGM